VDHCKIQIQHFAPRPTAMQERSLSSRKKFNAKVGFPPGAAIRGSLLTEITHADWLKKGTCRSSR
jgi:hypothetical protein